MNTIITNAHRVANELDMGGLFASRKSISEAFEYVDTITGSLRASDKVAVLTAVAVLCNAIRDQLRAE